MKHVSNDANEALIIATAAQPSVDTLKDTVTMLQKDVYKLAVLNRGLQQENAQPCRRSDNQDSYRRRDITWLFRELTSMTMTVMNCEGY